MRFWLTNRTVGEKGATKNSTSAMIHNFTDVREESVDFGGVKCRPPALEIVADNQVMRTRIS